MSLELKDLLTAGDDRSLFLEAPELGGSKLLWNVLFLGPSLPPLLRGVISSEKSAEPLRGELMSCRVLEYRNSDPLVEEESDIRSPLEVGL